MASSQAASTCSNLKGRPIAEAAIKRIAKLYAVEKLARGKSPEERVATRQKHAKDIFDDLEGWLQAQLPKISGKSPLAQAIRHALGRLPKARPYLENGVLEADNNSVERAMKPVAIGRQELDICRLRRRRQSHGYRLYPD